MINPQPAQPDVEKDKLEPKVKTSSKTTRKNREVYWLVGGLLVIGLIFIAYKFGKQSIVPSLNLPPASPLTQSSPTPSTDPMTNWKTFESSLLNLEGTIKLRYPPAWEIKKTQDTIFFYPTDELGKQDCYFKLDSTTNSCVFLRISQVKLDEKFLCGPYDSQCTVNELTTVEKGTNEYFFEYSEGQGDDGVPKHFKIITDYFYPLPNRYLKFEFTSEIAPGHTAFSANGGKGFLSNFKYKTELDQILSTFKFVE